VLNPDEGGNGKDWGEDEDNRREDAEKFHEKGREGFAKLGLEHT
jgi:hypothetical protein